MHMRLTAPPLPPPPQVVSGYDQVAGGDCFVEAHPSIGLAILSAPEPLHYYALFSHTCGCDVVVRGGGQGWGAAALQLRRAT
jgi:hypothetical protein